AKDGETFNGIPGERCWPPVRRPSVLPSLGGCPASCPDTYRLTHDHRHVRNWARAEIGFLSPLRNIFFGLGENFWRACLRKRSARCEHERLLRFCASDTHVHAFAEALLRLRRVCRKARCAARRG